LYDARRWSQQDADGKKVADAERRDGCSFGEKLWRTPKPQECYRDESCFGVSALGPGNKSGRVGRGANRQEGEKS
jgi:hypothetical protein